ncbi:H/ACA RNA-protein complex component Gar1 [Methanosalsum zhilinae DSM 4017]|uniref:H/ACA RNA-protein complex component Gar1 n=1 Tax=Methanosalsum zhilinae (strain DSM 4017 / NBRC 107636 / OCM 62 / WeN5) TaxID=679901 RepID=F7XMB6_METZD|nr:Gar1/Naf1 family protein [Methanosalsum zhilinae]AEH61014.1 H/ACA RNA-protein complex component Gar1 [Methanosalsum zhilinae DSM 4017]
MRRLGKVLHLTSQQNIIVRGKAQEDSVKTSDLPKINSVVVDKSVEKIGKINNVFGPINNPYYSVKPLKGLNVAQLKLLVNERVYVQ